MLYDEFLEAVDLAYEQGQQAANQADNGVGVKNPYTVGNAFRRHAGHPVVSDLEEECQVAWAYGFRGRQMPL